VAFGRKPRLDPKLWTALEIHFIKRRSGLSEMIFFITTHANESRQI
jgi:hypothetical protein